MYATEFSLSDLTAYIQGRGEKSAEITQGMTFLNQVIADSLTKSKNVVAVGRKYFSTEESPNDIARVDEFSLLEFRRGFYQAVHWGGATGLTINVNVTTGIFWNSQMHTCVDVALRAIQRRADQTDRLSQLHRTDPETQNEFNKIARTLRGVKFFIKYRGASRDRQLHIITGVSKETARTKTFEIDGEIMSVADYFFRTYNIRLRYPDAPLVRKGPNHYPMELCYLAPVPRARAKLTQMQRYPQKLDGTQASAMIRFASKVALHASHWPLNPDLRKTDIIKKVQALNWSNDPALRKFNITANPKMAPIPARILAHPTLSGGADMDGGAAFEPASGKWDLRGYRLKQVCRGTNGDDCSLVSWNGGGSLYSMSRRSFLDRRA
jgi:eukaryotic translation initiation factor 2C